MESRGWIKLYRQIQENEFYFSEKFTKSAAWIDLLILANRAPKSFYIRGILVSVKSGQVGVSQLTLSKRWKWS